MIKKKHLKQTEIYQLDDDSRRNVQLIIKIIIATTKTKKTLKLRDEF